MRNGLVFAGGLLLLTGGVLPGQQASPPLTLQDCIRLAISVPSTVSVARQEREIAVRESTQARAGFLPQSRLVSGFTYNSPLLNDRSTFSFLPLNGIREYSTLFTVTQDVDTSGRLRADLSRARAAREAASASLALTERDLKRNVTAAYYRLVLARQVAVVASEALKEGRSFEQRTKLLFEGGEAAQADVVKASAQAAFLQQALNSAELDARLANQDLASYWTEDSGKPLNIADAFDEALPAPEAQAAPAGVFLRRPEFNLLDAQKKGFQADARRARAGLLPQLGLVFQYGVDSTALRIRDRGYAAFLNLDIPLFDWMKARAAMQQARTRVDQITAGRAISARAFSRDYLSALDRVKQLYEQISLTREQARLAAEDLRLSRVRYEGGEGSALDVVTAQNQSAQARTNHYTTIANYLNARADLEVASGR